MINKELPNNLQVEQEILGDMLTSKKNISRYIGKVKIEDFYNGKHRKIYAGLMELFAEGQPLNITMLVNKIGKDNLKDIGGITYLADLSSGAISINANEYIKVLKEKSYRRKSIKEMQKAIEQAYQEDKDINVTVSNMTNTLTEIEDTGELIDDKSLMEITLNDIEERYRNNGKLPGFKSGFKQFDLVTGGLDRGQLVVISARPSMGKSAFALNLADGLAKYGQQVGFISMEMVEEELGIRRLASNSFIEMDKLKFGTLSDADFEKIGQTTNKIAKQNRITVDCSSTQTILTIKSKAMALKQTKGLDVLIIDHLGLINIKGKDVTREIGEVTRNLKMLAKELDIAVVLLTQLNRGVEMRQDKRPMMSDLRDSGRIEEDANIVVLLYRDEYYNKETEDKDIIEVNIAKNRNGSCGVIKMAFIKQFQIVSDLEYIN